MSTSTAYITVTNHHDELTQFRWATYCAYVATAVASAGRKPGASIAFEGASPPTSRHQRAMWAVHLPDDPDVGTQLRRDLTELARTFSEHPILWAECAAPEQLHHQTPPAATPPTRARRLRHRLPAVRRRQPVAA